MSLNVNGDIFVDVIEDVNVKLYIQSVHWNQNVGDAN